MATVHLDGDADGLTSAVQTYTDALGVGETLTMASASDSGISALVQDDSDLSYTLRYFSYSSTVFGASFTMDLSKTTAPVVANFTGATFDSSTTCYLGRDRVYTCQIEGSNSRAIFVEADIVPDAFSFSIVANTTTDMVTNATRLGNMRLAGDRAVMVYETAGGDGIATMDAADAGSATTASLTASGSIASARCLPFTSSSAIVTLPGQTAAVKINPLTGAINSETTSYVAGPSALAIYGGVDVLVGVTVGTSPLYGVRAETTLGETIDMGDTASTVVRVGDIQGQLLSNAYYAELGTGTTMTRYALTSAPAQTSGIPVYAAYENRTQLNSQGINSLEILANGDFSTTTSSNLYGVLAPAGALTTFSTPSISVYGDLGVAPNGDVFFNNGPKLYVSSGGNSTPVELSDQLGGSQSGGTTVLANGAVVTGSSSTALNVWKDGTLTRLTSITTISTTYIVTQVANGNLFVADRNASTFYFVDASVAGGSIVNSFTVSGLDDPGSSFKYDTDKFFVRTMGAQIWDVDAAAQSGTQVTITGASAGSGYGVALDSSGNLYEGSFSNGFFRSEPVV